MLDQTPSKPKVFCIGFHKTGTKSLSEALRILGYRVTGPNGQNDPAIATNVYALTDSLIKNFDAFQDNPWPIIYKELDKKYPNSKFILTLRNSELWLNSLIKHFGVQETPMRTWIYGVGSPVGNEETYLARYKKHNTDVVNHFKNREQNLLIMDLSKDDGWDKLCPFLDVDIQTSEFPHSNKANNRIGDKISNSPLKSIIIKIFRGDKA